MALLPKFTWTLDRSEPPVGSTSDSPVTAPAPPESRVPAETAHPTAELVERMCALGREALLLRPQIASTLSPQQRDSIRAVLDERMATITGGPVLVPGRDWSAWGGETSAEPQRTFLAVDPFLLDRHAVTNRQFACFVQAGGYQQLALWDENAREVLDVFRDQTGHPGPLGWSHGQFPPGRENHPVVGVSWFEACAYARWVGKRLPTDGEWLKAAAWPMAVGMQVVQRKFPWGEMFDPRCANLWETGRGQTVPVDAFAQGDNPAGVRQLIGNVWEWTSSVFAAYDRGADLDIDGVWYSLRGGAFDTYFSHQASSEFQSGDPPMARRSNVGFRCALGLGDVTAVPEATT